MRESIKGHRRRHGFTASETWRREKDYCIYLVWDVVDVVVLLLSDDDDGVFFSSLSPARPKKKKTDEIST